MRGPLPLVLIPGMMQDARLFGPQIAALSGSRAILLAPCSGADTMAELAAVILAAAPPQFALAGLSMGGIVAMEIAREAPERIDRIALLDTNPRAELPEVRAARQPQIARVLAGDLEALMRDEVVPTQLAAGTDHRVSKLCLGMALALGPDVFVRQSRALAARPDQQGTLARLTCPALILMGAEDRPCPRDRHELMHRLMPHARFVVIDGAGHLPTLERPDETTAELVRWLEE